MNRRVALLGIASVAVVVGGTVSVLSLRDDSGHSEPVIATQPVQRGWGLYLGSVSGLTVGIATNGRTVQAFASNAKEVSWFDGLLAGNSFDITAANGATLAAGVVGGNAHGRYVTPNGAVIPFDVPAPVSKGALYRGSVITADGGRIDAGSVVSETGAVTGGVTVTSAKGVKAALTKPITAAALETAGTADTGQGIVPLRRVKPDTLDQPVPTALTGAALGNQPGREVKKEDFSKVTNVDKLNEPPAPTGSSVIAQLSGPATVEAHKPFEIKLSLGNPGAQAVDGAAIDLGLPAAFSMGDRPDEAIPAGCADSKLQEATTVADDEVEPNGSQLLAHNITLPPGGTCDLTIDVIAAVAGVFELVTSPPRAPGRPAGTSGRLTITVKTAQGAATAGDPAAVPNGICAAPGNSPTGTAAMVANVALGASPLPVRLSTTGFGDASSWTMKFSDGTPSITCDGAPPAMIPHTFINFADPSTSDAVVFTAELTTTVKGTTKGPFRVPVEVVPRLKDKSRRIATLVSPVNEAFVRGTFSTATVEVLNAGDEDLKAGATVSITVASDPAAITFAALEPTSGPWTCPTARSCRYDATIGKLASPPPLRLTVGVPAPGPQDFRITTTVDAVTVSNSTQHVDRVTLVPVDGIIARASAGGQLRPPETGVLGPLSVGNTGVVSGATTGKSTPPPPPTPEFPSLVLDKNERLAPTLITLDGRASIHGQRPTTYKWEQVRVASDPTVKLDSGGTGVIDTFRAPLVLVPTDLVFKLTVADSLRSDDDTITIKIKPINRPPVIVVDSTARKAPTGELLPDTGKSFSLKFAAKEPDGEATTLTWDIDTPVPAGAVVVKQSTLSIPKWPIDGVPQVVAIATATDSRGMVAAKTVLIGVKPAPPSLTMSGPATATPGSHVDVQVSDSTGSTTAFTWELAEGSAPATIDTTTGTSIGVDISAEATPGDVVKIRVRPGGVPDPVAEIAITVLPAPVSLQVPTIAIPDADCVDVTIDSFPAIPLPGDFLLASGSATNCNGTLHVVADAIGPNSATLHIEGDQFADGFAGTIEIHGLVLFGGTVAAEGFQGTIDTRNGGQLTLDIAGATLGIPGVVFETAHVVLSAGGIAVDATAEIGGGDHPFRVHISGVLANTGAFALLVEADAEQVAPIHPSLPPIDSASFKGSLEWDGVALHFRLSTAVATSWQPLGDFLTITGLQVEFGNVDPPASCPSADGLFLAVHGTATLDAQLTPDPIALSIGGCLGLPGSGGSGDGSQPFFQIDSTVDLGSWRPIAGVDLVVKNVGITVKFVGDDLSLDVHGEASILGLDVQVSARVVNTSFVVIATADLRQIGIPLDNATVAIASPPGVDDFDIDLDGDSGTGPQVDLPGGITAIATMAVPNVDVLNQVLNPENKSADDPDPPPHIDANLLFLANVSDAGITLKAGVDLGAGLTLLKLCSAGVFNQCDSMLDATTELSLTGFELGLAVGAGGFEVSASVFGILKLPKRDAVETTSSDEVRDVLEIGATVFVAPPVVGFSLFVKGEWTNPFGIDGFAITKAALQVSLDFTTPPPAGPIPSVGILLEAQGLPSLLGDVLHQSKPETVRVAVNISKTAPIFEMTLGNHGDGTFLKPHDSLEIDDASLVIAPLGGKIGPFTYTPGIHLSFGGKIFSLSADGTFDVTLVPPKISGHLNVGALQVGPLTIEQTALDVVVDPAAAAFCMRAKGGVSIARGGPRFNADVSFVTGPGSCAGFPAPPADGIAISGSITATAWTLGPGVKLTNIRISTDLSGLTNPTVELVVESASAAVMGINPTVTGSLRFANGIVEKFSLSTSVGQLAVGPIAIECPDGPCITLNYDANAQPQVQAQVRGKVTMGATGMSVAIDGVLDTTHVAMTAKLQAGTSKINGIVLNGELFFGASDPDARIINASGQSVVAQRGDFRLSARTVDAIEIGATTAKWVFAVGRANGEYYANGSADLDTFGATAHVSGNFRISAGTLGFHVEGKSSGEVDTAKHSLNLVERTAIRAALPNAGHYDEGLDVTAKLVFRADYKFKVILDSGTGLSVSADGSTSLRYVEYPGGNAERRSKQTVFADGTLSFDSKSGQFCYKVTIDSVEYKAGSC